MDYCTPARSSGQRAHRQATWLYHFRLVTSLTRVPSRHSDPLRRSFMTHSCCTGLSSLQTALHRTAVNKVAVRYLSKCCIGWPFYGWPCYGWPSSGWPFSGWPSVVALVVLNWVHLDLQHSGTCRCRWDRYRVSLNVPDWPQLGNVRVIERFPTACTLLLIDHPLSITVPRYLSAGRIPLFSRTKTQVSTSSDVIAERFTRSPVVFN